MPQNLVNLTIDEMSLVDRPANAEIDPKTGEKIPRARIALLKRDEPVAKGQKFLVTEDDGTTHLPYTDESGKPDHRLMGAAWAALHGGFRGKPYEGPDKQKAIERLKQVYESEGLKTPAEKSDQGQEPGVPNTKGDSPTMTLEQIEKRVTEQDAEIAALKADRDAAKAEADVLKSESESILKMSEAEQKCMAKMSAEKKKAFLKATPEERKALMAEHQEPDGDECMKQELEQVTKAYDEKLAKRDQQIAKLEADNAAILKRERTAHFVAIAKQQLSHTSGSDEAKAETLMKMADALGGEESEAYKQAFGAMAKADEILASQFVEKGAWGGGNDNPGAALEAKAQEISKRDHISVEKAYDRAMTENPDLYRRYREEWDRRHTVRG